MSTDFKPSHSRAASGPPSSRTRSIKFADPFVTDPRAPSMGNRAITTRPVPPSSIVRRSNTVCATRPPRPAGGGAINVEERPLLGRVAPGAQFEMVTPPRSPRDIGPSKGSRLPLRTRSANPSGDIKHRPAISRGSHYDNSAAGARAPGPAPAPLSQNARPSVISVLGWAESQASFAALNRSTGLFRKRTAERGALPSVWTSAPSRKPSMHRQNTLPAAPSEPMAEVAPRRAGSDPEVKPGPPSYPRLTVGEQNVLVRKLRVLLKCIGNDNRALDDWDKSVISQDVAAGGSWGVFGTSVKNSASYASCQVVLGDHSHNLPVCVFASVEEICRRGVTTPALFRLAPPPNERTLEKLTQAFDQGPSYGANLSLAKEDISNVCALLKLYLRGLPEATLSNSLWSILQQLTLDSRTETRAARIAAVQAILHLQHPTSFSLLVYVLAFLHQLVLHGPQNGLDIPTLAGIFGPALFSPRKGGDLGCVMSPKPDGPVLVKTFLSARDMREGTRVMSWVLEHWEGIATGLLSLDIVHGTEKDIQAWEASFVAASESGTPHDGGLSFFGGESESEYSEGPSIELVDPAIERLEAFPFPETVKFDEVPVREVRNSIVEIAEPPPQSTRASSPATFWSQDTAQPIGTSRTASLASTTGKADSEPEYVRKLRQRMDAQEAELVSLRQELAMIRSRCVFPLPPINAPGAPDITKPAMEDVLNEDTMPTPRPPSGPHFTTMRELIDSLQSEPVTPLYHHTIQSGAKTNQSGNDPGAPTASDSKQPAGDSEVDSKHSTHRDSGYSSHSEDDILHSKVFSDSMPSTPSPFRGEFYVVNPEPEDDATATTKETIDETGATRDAGESEVRDNGKLEELFTARDALRSALAAMDPVKAQLKAVEDELQLRGAGSA